MKGAFILSRAQDLYEQAETVLVDAGAASTPDRVAQLRDAQQRLITIYGRIDSFLARDLLEPPVEVRGTGTPPDPSTASACWIECRSEETFTHWVHRIAGRLDDTLWVLDGDGVLWAADALDPSELRL